MSGESKKGGFPFGCVFMILLVVVTVFGVRSKMKEDKERSYETNVISDQLQQIQGQKLVLLTFEYDQNLLYGQVMGAEEAQPLIEYHQAQLMEQLGQLFEIEIYSGDPLFIEGSDPSNINPQLLKETLTSLDAAGGVVVRNAYGFQMKNSIGDAVEEEIFNDTPVDNVPFLGDPSEVERYFLVSDTYIINKDGNIIWRFFGKSSKIPTPFTGSAAEKVESFFNRFAGINPTSEEMFLIMSEVVNLYTDFNKWLIEKDIAGSTDKNFFEDYDKPGDSVVFIYPADTEGQSPLVNLDSSKTIDRSNWLAEIWEKSKDSKWSKFGQWEHAWAALQLLLVSLVAAIVLAAIGDKAGEGSVIKDWVGFPVVIFSIAFFVSIFFLLRALL